MIWVHLILVGIVIFAAWDARKHAIREWDGEENGN